MDDEGKSFLVVRQDDVKDWKFPDAPLDELANLTVERDNYNHFHNLEFDSAVPTGVPEGKYLSGGQAVLRLVSSAALTAGVCVDSDPLMWQFPLAFLGRMADDAFGIKSCQRGISIVFPPTGPSPTGFILAVHHLQEYYDGWVNFHVPLNMLEDDFLALNGVRNSRFITYDVHQTPMVGGRLVLLPFHAVQLSVMVVEQVSGTRSAPEFDFETSVFVLSGAQPSLTNGTDYPRMYYDVGGQLRITAALLTTARDNGSTASHAMPDPGLLITNSCGHISGITEFCASVMVTLVNVGSLYVCPCTRCKTQAEKYGHIENGGRSTNTNLCEFGFAPFWVAGWPVADRHWSGDYKWDTVKEVIINFHDVPKSDQLQFMEYVGSAINLFDSVLSAPSFWNGDLERGIPTRTFEPGIGDIVMSYVPLRKVSVVANALPMLLFYGYRFKIIYEGKSDLFFDRRRERPMIFGLDALLSCCPQAHIDWVIQMRDEAFDSTDEFEPRTFIVSSLGIFEERDYEDGDDWITVREFMRRDNLQIDVLKRMVDWCDRHPRVWFFRWLKTVLITGEMRLSDHEVL